MLRALLEAEDIVSKASIEMGERNIPSQRRSLLAPLLREAREGLGIEIEVAMTC